MSVHDGGEDVKTLLGKLKNVGINGDMQREDKHREITSKLQEIVSGIVTTDEERSAKPGTPENAKAYIDKVFRQTLEEIQRKYMNPLETTSVHTNLGQMKNTVTRIRDRVLQGPIFSSVRGHIDTLILQVNDFLRMLHEYDEIET